ncbi:MAG TPA: ABC transporter permease [Candidatus Methanofastidiosa archaeon]|nr:ABC transporter permease [Candidatus Methanofastidiosa archaeon]HPR41690.1 ABC transporter permease [Candidatus Methanofastidiosa archaeon]
MSEIVDFKKLEETKKKLNRKLYAQAALVALVLILVRMLLISRDNIDNWGLRLAIVGVYILIWYLFLDQLYKRWRDINYKDERNPIDRFVHRLYHNKLATVGLFIVLSVAILALFAPEIALYGSEYQADWKDYALMPPSREHPFGTVSSGEDLFSLICYGSQISLVLGIGVEVIVAVIGIALGVISGYYGGAIDKIIHYFTDVIMSFPFLILVIVLVGALRANPDLNERIIDFSSSLGMDAHLLMVFLALTVFGWPGIFRQVRGQVFSIKERDYVAAAKVVGASRSSILFRHIAINTLGPVIVVMTLGIAGVILTEAGLSFLGFGADITTPSWGRLLSEGNSFVTQSKYLYLALFPGIALFLTILGFTTLGDGIRDAIDPRLKL